jgi:15-cis-phytoene synthase
MTLKPAWERRLLALAEEGRPRSLPGDITAVDQDLLRKAYGHCDVVAKKHSRTFYMASSLLPSAKRRAVRALYAFCRVTDDLIDRAQGDLAAGLAAWEDCAMADVPTCDDLVALAWADTRAQYGIPACYAEQLVQGVAADLTKKRYADFEELVVYCYGVASTVGLMSMHIVGFSDHSAIPYAVKLGVAMQLTNILRDVQEDWQAGRVYLPQDELAAFGLSDAAIAAGKNTDQWRAFMRFQIERNQQLYEEASPGIAMLERSGRFSIAAAADLYRAILGDIETNDCDVFSRRAHLSTAAKLRRLPGIWWRSRRADNAVVEGERTSQAPETEMDPVLS